MNPHTAHQEEIKMKRSSERHLVSSDLIELLLHSENLLLGVIPIESEAEFEESWKEHSSHTALNHSLRSSSSSSSSSGNKREAIVCGNVYAICKKLGSLKNIQFTKSVSHPDTLNTLRATFPTYSSNTPHPDIPASSYPLGDPTSSGGPRIISGGSAKASNSTIYPSNSYHSLDTSANDTYDENSTPFEGRSATTYTNYGNYSTYVANSGVYANRSAIGPTGASGVNAADSRSSSRLTSGTATPQSYSPADMLRHRTSINHSDVSERLLSYNEAVEADRGSGHSHEKHDTHDGQDSYSSLKSYIHSNLKKKSISLSAPNTSLQRSSGRQADRVRHSSEKTHGGDSCEDSGPAGPLVAIDGRDLHSVPVSRLSRAGRSIASKASNSPQRVGGTANSSPLAKTPPLKEADTDNRRLRADMAGSGGKGLKGGARGEGCLGSKGREAGSAWEAPVSMNDNGCSDSLSDSILESSEEHPLPPRDTNKEKVVNTPRNAFFSSKKPSKGFAGVAAELREQPSVPSLESTDK